MKLLVNVFFASSFVLAFTITAARADGPALMTIRFNQPQVAYKSRLADVVKQATATKPTVVFDVVDVTTSGTGTHGQEVADAIAKTGVPGSQVSLRSETGAVANEEVRIFVR